MRNAVFTCSTLASSPFPKITSTVSRRCFRKPTPAVRLFGLEGHDLALSKLERNSPRDREDVKYLAHSVPLDLGLLEARYRLELRPYGARRTARSDDAALARDVIAGVRFSAATFQCPIHAWEKSYSKARSRRRCSLRRLRARREKVVCQLGITCPIISGYTASEEFLVAA